MYLEVTICDLKIWTYLLILLCEPHALTQRTPACLPILNAIEEGVRRAGLCNIFFILIMNGYYNFKK